MTWSCFLCSADECQSASPAKLGRGPVGHVTAHRLQRPDISRNCCHYREEGAQTLIEQMTRDLDPIIRYGGMFTIALAYRGTANNGAVQQLLHFAVSDVNDNVRRAAVLCLGFLLLDTPQQCPRLVSLLVRLCSPHSCCDDLGPPCLRFVPSWLQSLAGLQWQHLDGSAAEFSRAAGWLGMHSGFMHVCCATCVHVQKSRELCCAACRRSRTTRTCGTAPRWRWASPARAPG